MVTIGILTLVLVGTSVSAVTAQDVSGDRPDANCIFSKDVKGNMVADCRHNNLLSVPGNVIPDVQRLDLRNNYIGKLANDSFTIYPNIKILLLSFNQVHTIEAESLEVLSELKTLDLSQNAVKEVPAGLPKSLTTLYLSGNPVANTRNLDRAVGLQTLHLKSCDLDGYPALGLLPNLIELDVSNNGRIRDLDPAQLAGTCRLTKLNITGARLFLDKRPGSYCRCRRVEEWARTYKIQLFGMGPCPGPVDADKNSGGDDDPASENCTRPSDEALAVFKACIAEWEHRNTPYWAICTGLAIVVAVFLTLCACLRRRKRRSRRRNAADKAHHQNSCDASPTDAKDAAAAANIGGDSAAGNDRKTEPAALLPSPTA